MIRRQNPGNAIMEYALPLAIVLVVCGVLATAGDIQKIMARFFMSASGHTQSDLKNGVLHVDNRPDATTPTGNGSEGFTGLGGVTDGDGNRVGGNPPAPQNGESGNPNANYWEPEEN